MIVFGKDYRLSEKPFSLLPGKVTILLPKKEILCRDISKKPIMKKLHEIPVTHVAPQTVLTAQKKKRENEKMKTNKHSCIAASLAARPLLKITLEFRLRSVSVLASTGGGREPVSTML
jgi:hypothetical protein